MYIVPARKPRVCHASILALPPRSPRRVPESGLSRPRSVPCDPPRARRQAPARTVDTPRPWRGVAAPRAAGWPGVRGAGGPGQAGPLALARRPPQRLADLGAPPPAETMDVEGEHRQRHPLPCWPWGQGRGPHGPGCDPCPPPGGPQLGAETVDAGLHLRVGGPEVTEGRVCLALPGRPDCGTP